MSKSIPDMQSSLRFDSLSWVNEELRQLLVDIQRELETLTRAAEAADVQPTIILLEQLTGTLSLIEINGASLLGKEMIALLEAFAKGEVDKKEHSLELVISSALRIEDYLGYLSSGHADIPALLLPVINDLREARNAELMSDKVVFMPDFQSAMDTIQIQAIESSDIQETAKKRRPEYQTGLVALFKKDNVATACQRMQSVLHTLYETSQERLSANMWWIGAALIDVVGEIGEAEKSSLFALLGKLDRNIKVLVDEGESGLQKVISFELIKNMLYYIAQSQVSTDRVNEAKTIYKLDEYLVKDLRDGTSSWMGPPNKQLIDTVSVAVVEDVNAIKDVIDVYSHSDRKDMAGLQQASVVMQKIGDTLTMLGLDATKDRIINEKALLDQQITDQTPLDNEAMMSIASVLLTIEEDLQAYSDNRDTLSDVKSQAVNDDSNDDTSVIAENRKVTSTLANEALRDLSWVKDVYLDYLMPDGKAEVLSRVPKVMRSVAGAMFIHPLSGIVTSLNELKDYIENVLIAQGHKPKEKEQNIFAEVITNIECFLEATVENRLDAELFIDAANLALDDLEAASPVVSVSENISAIADDLQDLAGELQTDMPDGLPTSELGKPETPVAVKEETTAAVQSEAVQLAPPARQDLQIVGADADGEIIEIFIEEALEELERISEMFPQWHNNPSNSDAITVIRRSFHTLKGSGRIIGAQLIGEFAWTFENLLNRIIDGTVEVNNNIFDAIGESIPLLPQLIEQISSDNHSPLAEVTELMDKVDALSATQNVNSNNETDAALVSAEAFNDDLVEVAADDEIDLPAAQEVVYEDGSPSEEITLSAGDLLLGGETSNNEPSVLSVEHTLPSIEEDVDTELIRIFTDEVSSHLATIEEFVSEASASSTPLHGNEGLYRAFHTVHGGAKTSPTFSFIAGLAEVLESLYNSLKSLSMPWSNADLDLLRLSLDFIRNELDALAEKNTHYDDKSNAHQRVSNRLAELKSKLTAQYKVLTETQAHEVDDELIDVFMEEGEELLDVLEQAVHQAVSRDFIDSSLPEILRVLHTLKGGARMAGLGTVGDLSHSLESVFVDIAENKLPFNDAVKSAVQKSTDTLSNMVNVLRGNKTPADAPDLIAELEQLIVTGGTAPIEPDAILRPEIKADADHQPPAAGEVIEIESLADDIVIETESEIAAANLLTAEEAVSTTREDPFSPAPIPVQELFDEEKDKQEELSPVMAGRQDMIRVQSGRLENLVNYAGEVNIFQSRLGQYIHDLSINLVEVDNTLERLRGQLRNMELETEAQILSRQERERDDPNLEFDPLEMDRYSNMQHLTRAISESADDLFNIKSTLGDLLRESETTVQQQSRVATDLQDGLLKTQMVSFEGLLSRLRRLVRQTAQQLTKKVEISIKGFDTEIDRSVQVMLISSLEHMLRNAIYHGIELPADRIKAGKPEVGRINMQVRRDGSYIVIEIHDDGAGINPAAVRNKAIAAGLIKADQQLEEKDILQLILSSGFTTATEVSQIAGRGVGMDVVDSQIKELGGSLQIDSTVGAGSSFSIRLPQTLSISNGLMVELEETPYVVLLTAITGIATISGDKIVDHIKGDFSAYEYGGELYPVHYLGSLLNVPIPESLKDNDMQIPLVLIKGAGRKIALIVDKMLGKRELVVKPVGVQMSGVRGISGATILGDGMVAFILDAIELLQSRYEGTTSSHIAIAQAEQLVDDSTNAEKAVVKQKVMVVDDSITIRKVSQRLLERNGYEVFTAKDGVDAIEKLQSVEPDLFLLDIEMPRMDGFELTTHIRNNTKIRHLPIIMITSRTGAKHRERAEALSVNCYLGKPFQEAELIKEIEILIGDE